MDQPKTPTNALTAACPICTVVNFASYSLRHWMLSIASGSTRAIEVAPSNFLLEHHASILTNLAQYRDRLASDTDD